MKALKSDDIKEFLRSYVLQKLISRGGDLAFELSDDCDLLLEGFIDSLGVLELTGAISDYCGTEIDFEAIDPEHMTIVGPLCRFVADQVEGQ